MGLHIRVDFAEINQTMDKTVVSADMDIDDIYEAGLTFRIYMRDNIFLGDDLAVHFVGLNRDMNYIEYELFRPGE